MFAFTECCSEKIILGGGGSWMAEAFVERSNCKLYVLVSLDSALIRQG